MCKYSPKLAMPETITVSAYTTEMEQLRLSSENFPQVMIKHILPAIIYPKIPVEELYELDYYLILRRARLATWGPLFSLVLGIFADMAFVENTIFFTLAFPAISFASAFVSNFFINRRFFAYMGAAILGLLITAGGQLLKTAASDTFSMVMVTTALLQTAWSIPFAVLAYFPPARLSRLE